MWGKAYTSLHEREMIMEEGEDENDLQTRNVFTSNPSWRLILVLFVKGQPTLLPGIV